LKESTLPNNVDLIPGLVWLGEKSDLISTDDGIQRALLDNERPLWVVEQDGMLCITSAGKIIPGLAAQDGKNVLGFAPALPLTRLGDANFCHTYHTQYAYYAGAMANGISTEKLVITLGKHGLMGSYGSGGVSPQQVEAAIRPDDVHFPVTRLVVIREN